MSGERILGILRSANGHGVVRVEDRFTTGVDDLWSALTDPARLARWLGDFEGDLRLGGTYRSRFFASGAEALGRIEACDPPYRFTVVTKGPAAANEQTIDATLSADGDGTVLVVEQSGLRLDWLAAFGAGLQVHLEDLAAHVTGGERGDCDARMSGLVPAYEALPVAG